MTRQDLEARLALYQVTLLQMRTHIIDAAFHVHNKAIPDSFFIRDKINKLEEALNNLEKQIRGVSEL